MRGLKTACAACGPDRTSAEEYKIFFAVVWAIPWPALSVPVYGPPASELVGTNLASLLATALSDGNSNGNLTAPACKACGVIDEVSCAYLEGLILDECLKVGNKALPTAASARLAFPAHLHCTFFQKRYGCSDLLKAP